MGCRQPRQKTRTRGRRTEICQSVVEPPPPLVKTFMRDSLPLQLLRQHLRALGPQECLVEPIQNRGIVVHLPLGPFGVFRPREGKRRLRQRRREGPPRPGIRARFNDLGLRRGRRVTRVGRVGSPPACREHGLARSKGASEGQARSPASRSGDSRRHYCREFVREVGGRIELGVVVLAMGGNWKARIPSRGRLKLEEVFWRVVSGQWDRLPDACNHSFYRYS